MMVFCLMLSATQQKTTKQISIPVLVQHSATLSWSDNDTNVAYHVYRSTTSGSGYIMITVSPVVPKSYVDLTIQSGITYYYVITAFDISTGLESGYSNEVTAVVPLP